MFINWEDWLYL